MEIQGLNLFRTQMVKAKFDESSDRFGPTILSVVLASQYSALVFLDCLEAVKC